MKRKVIVILVVMVLVAVIAGVMSGCDTMTQQSELEHLQELYGEIGTAKAIEQRIEITKGEFVQFESEKLYSKTESGYTVTGREKRLNDTDAEELYDEKEINESVQKAVDAAPTLRLEAEYFQAGFRLSETGLTANVKPGNIKEVFGITGQLKAPTDDLMFELSVSGRHLSTVRIEYESEGSHVEITLTMTY